MSHFFSNYTKYLKLVATFIILASLVSCSSAPKKKQVITQTETEPEETKQTALTLLNQAQSATKKNKLTFLLAANKQAIAESDYILGLFIANQLLALELPDYAEHLATVYQARCLYQLGEATRATEVLATQKETFVKDKAYWLLQSELTYNANDELASIKALLNLTASSFDNELTYANLIWQRINGLPTWQSKHLTRIKHKDIAAWVELRELFASNQLYSGQLSTWLNKNANHPGAVLIPHITPKTSPLLQINNVAVLLPLSGREKSLGHIVQEGLISAYQARPEFNLHFFDSNALSVEEISQQIRTVSADFIVGPLLKKHVTSVIEFRAQDSDAIEDVLSQQNVDYFKSKPILLLNSHNKVEAKNNIYSFSLSPEDEAIQAADILSERGYKKPIVLSSDNAIGQRVASAFSSRWQTLTNTQPIEVIYKDAGKMKDVVEEIMEVDDSKERFKALDKRINEKIFDMSRNRRDIDMIYLFGNTTQTRLLKPFIDVNIAPFAETIPIYASSRSHSSKEDRNISQDLVGLTFTDMPWLLPSKKQNVKLKEQSGHIWPNRKDNLQRLFAMGYDSYQIINKLAFMAANSLYHHDGQTGKLRLSLQGRIERELEWGTYQRKRVKTIAMD